MVIRCKKVVREAEYKKTGERERMENTNEGGKWRAAPREKLCHRQTPSAGIQWSEGKNVSETRLVILILLDTRLCKYTNMAGMQTHSQSHIRGILLASL